MSDKLTEAVLRVEKWNDQFRQANPNGKYPLCHPIVGDPSSRCERCGGYAGYDRPCPAVPPEKRWGPDYVSPAASENGKTCQECGKYPADAPSKICVGCAAYKEHTAI